jgi:hypothetical protein
MNENMKLDRSLEVYLNKANFLETSLGRVCGNGNGGMTV